jgi:hypothetical protein
LYGICFDGQKPLDENVAENLRDIVLAHELVEGDVIWVLPPLFPVCAIGVAGISEGLGD